MSEPPSHLDVADHFYHDSCDLLSRFEFSFNSESISFYSVKSRRMKCFVDLRMAMESALKAYTAYYCHSDISGKELVCKIESYRHHLNKLIDKCIKYLPDSEQKECEKLCSQLTELPVGLRYKLDVMDFIDAREKEYYATVGNDNWMGHLKDSINRITTYIGKELAKESRVISGGEIPLEELMGPAYNKYSKKNS
jgi:hypothetical protein